MIYPLLKILADLEEMAERGSQKKMLIKIAEAQAWANGWWAGFTHGKNESYYGKKRKIEEIGEEE